MGKPWFWDDQETAARTSAAHAGTATAGGPADAAASRAMGPNGNGEVVETVVKDEHDKIGRNDPCWCGSGKKYKKCHGS